MIHRLAIGKAQAFDMRKTAPVKASEVVQITLLKSSLDWFLTLSANSSYLSTIL